MMNEAVSTPIPTVLSVVGCGLHYYTGQTLGVIDKADYCC